MLGLQAARQLCACGCGKRDVGSGGHIAGIQLPRFRSGVVVGIVRVSRGMAKLVRRRNDFVLFLVETNRYDLRLSALA